MNSPRPEVPPSGPAAYPDHWRNCDRQNSGSACRSFFGVDVEDAYSATEAGSIAMQCPDCGGYHVMAETHDRRSHRRIRASLRPRRNRSGDRHRLHQLSRCPLIRYEIGDYAEVGEPGTCGRGLPVLNSILGRQRNLMILPDGRRQWPSTGFYRFRDVAPVLAVSICSSRPARRSKINLRRGTTAHATPKKPRSAT